MGSSAADQQELFGLGWRDRLEVRKEDSHIDPWWGIWDRETGKRVSGVPQPFYHPQLRRTVSIRKRRWRAKREAEAALSDLLDILVEACVRARAPQLAREGEAAS